MKETKMATTLSAPPESGNVTTMTPSDNKQKARKPLRPKKIWIDLENSPHVPFFKPIIEQLEAQGHLVTVTARDCFQVCDLADLYHMDYKAMGRHFGKHKLAKMFGLGLRVLQMSPTAIFDRPDLCLSHGSRSHVIVSALFRIPNMIIFDYEHTAWVKWMRPQWVMAPEVIAEANIVNKGIPKETLLRYRGIKEDVYATTFKPSPDLRQRLGIEENEILVTIRPPASEAHYHNPEAEILQTAVFEMLNATPDVRVVLVPRTPKQGEEIRAQFPEMFASKKAFIPEQVVDGLDLIWASDLVISGGGTMNREAAALDVPVYSIFRGTIGAVDHYLVDQKRLVLIEKVEDVKTKINVVRRDKSISKIRQSAALETVLDNVLNILEAQEAK
jgi:predicted glycosyltransferase